MSIDYKETKNNLYRQPHEPHSGKENDLWYKPIIVDGKEQYELNICINGKWKPHQADRRGKSGIHRRAM